MGDKLSSGEISASAAADMALARAAKFSHLNAFISLHETAAAAAAQAAGKMLRQSGKSALCGIPVAVKDVFCTIAGRTTCASRMLADYRSPFESHATAQLLEKGAVIIGKTNMDEFAMGTTGENSAFGPTLNPWDETRAAGGSSSGSAAAVAARIVPAALGTDTGGSVRMPAAYCGICAIKPTYGLVSRRGMVAYASSLDQAGVLATSAADLRTVLAAIASHDAGDSTSLEDAPPVALRTKTDLAGLRIGIAEELFGQGVSAGVGACVRRAVGKLTELGGKIISIDLPAVEHAVPAYYLIACAEASSNLSRFDGIRYGRRAEAEDLQTLVKRSRSQGFGREVQRRIMLGAFALSHGYAERYYLKALRMRHRLSLDFAGAFAACDLIAAPAAPTVAPRLGEFSDDPVRMYSQDVCTVPASLAGLPAVSLPCGTAELDLPVGLQMIGPRLSENLLLNAAQTYQDETDFHLRMPPGTEQ